MPDAIKIEKGHWPGLDARKADPEEYICRAIDPIDKIWKWDDREHRKFCMALLNADQIALWSIWNIGGQIDNGGIVQALYNSYGELAEEAVAGFRQFDFNEIADLLDGAFDKFTRPIPLNREERWRMLETALEMRLGDLLPEGGHAAERSLGMYHRARLLLGDVDKNYYALTGSFDDYRDSLSRKIDDRKGSFFLLDEPPSTSAPERAWLKSFPKWLLGRRQ